MVVVVSDATCRGIEAARRIAELRNELDIRIEKAYLIVHGVRGELPAALGDPANTVRVPMACIMPGDSAPATFECAGRPLVELGAQTAAYEAVGEMMQQILKS